MLEIYYKQHISSIKSEERKFQCPNCPRKYIHKRHLNRHMKQECGKPPRTQCPYCEFATYYKRDIQHHIRWHHPDKVPKTV